MKTGKILAFIMCVTLSIVSFPVVSSAATPPAGEEAVFATSLAPDALIVLDLSGSMRWTPAGEKMYILSSQNCGENVPFYPSTGATHIQACPFDAYGTVPLYGDASCAGPFYFNSGTGHTTNCRRIMIARRAIFDILDYNDDNTINLSDETSLNVRVGYMRFTDGYDT